MNIRMLYTEKKNDTHAPKHNDNKTEQERIVLKTNKLYLHCTALHCTVWKEQNKNKFNLLHFIINHYLLYIKFSFFTIY